MANAYVMRTNMSVAIVAMVNHTALPRDDTVSDDECDSDNSSNSWVAEMSKHSQVMVRTHLIILKIICIFIYCSFEQLCGEMNFLAFVHSHLMLCF
jgi:hypothetical protein